MTSASQDNFAALLQSYLGSINPGLSHDARRIRFLGLLKDALGVDLSHVEVELPIGTGRRYDGRIDSLYGDLVIEFKRNLAREFDDAVSQLTRYIAGLRSNNPTRQLTGVATDGLRVIAFRPEYGGDGLVTSLRPIGKIDLSEAGKSAPDAYKVFQWLDALFTDYREQRPATTVSVVGGLGPPSPALRIATDGLADLYRRLGDDPALELRVTQWQRYLALVYGDEAGDQGLFLKHTYLATVARLVAYLRLGFSPMPSDKDLEDILRGGFFEERAGLANFVEEDFFTWLFLDPVRQDGLALVRRLLNTLNSYDFSQVSEDVLKELYQGLVDPETRHDLGEYYTPDWLAELMLRDELGLDKDPHRSVLDPACGSGTFLFIAVRIVREALEREGADPTDILERILENVVGMDVHPLAVTIARTNYLLALGDLLQHRRGGDVTIPVYLTDAMRLPELDKPLAGSPDTLNSYAIEADGQNIVLQIPYSLAMNPSGLDYLLPFMKRKYGSGGMLRAPDKAAEQGVEDSLFQFLIARGNARKRFVLSAPEAEVVVQTERTLVDLMRQGRDTLWFFILRNALRPVYLQRKQFDIIVGNPPWLSLRYIRNPRYYEWVRRQILDEYRLLDRGSPHLFTQMEMATLFFARAADLYLKDKGRIAFVMPRSVMVAQQHAGFTKMVFKRGGLLQLGLQKVLDLEGVTPLFNVPACVLAATKGQWPQDTIPGQVLRGDLLVKNRSLEEARRTLTFAGTAYQRAQGRLVAEGSPVLTTRQGRSYYYSKFYQGATIVPRNLWFVHIPHSPIGFNKDVPFFETDPETTRQAKAPWKSVKMQGQVEARFLYATLPSGNLVPFGYTRLVPVILPLANEGGRYVMLNADGAYERGAYQLQDWLRSAQFHWERLARKDASGQPKEPSVVNWLNYRNKLTTQNPDKRYRVLYNAAGTNLCSAIVDCSGLVASGASEVTAPFEGYLTDHELYVYETDLEEEANYLVASLNASILDDLIKPTQTRGLWGARHIHKRPLQFPIPQFDSEDATHMRLAELGKECAGCIAEVMPELASRYKSVGRMRGEVRRLLETQLAEIDALAREVLGAESNA